MKTIFDKIDPKYIECTTGVCEHTAHSLNTPLWVVIATLSLILISIVARSKREY